MNNKNLRTPTLTKFALGLAALAATTLATPSFAQTANIAVKIGGYLKLDAMSSDYSDGDLDIDNIGRDFYLPSIIPVHVPSATSPVALDEGRDTDFHARSSRINFQTTSDIEGHKLVGFFELDFMTGAEGDERVSNSYQPRLRHAYFTYDKWLFGQTWSTFQNVAALPETLDFIGPSEGTVFIRQAQVRYTHGNWQFALENPETTVTPYQTAGRISDDGGAIPDVVARYSFKGERGNLDVAGIVRSLAYESAADDIDETSVGYGLSVSGKFAFGSRDDVRFMVTHGAGLGRYLALNLVNAAILDENGELETVDSTAAMLSFRHLWNDQWRSNLSLGMFKADHDTSLASSGVTKQAQSLHLNLLYSPVKNVTFGGEIIAAKRELESDHEGNLNRLQLSARFDF